MVLNCCSVPYADHLLSSFLEHFPTFPNSFLVGGPADYFVIELTDQVARFGKQMCYFVRLMLSCINI
jgi:hypothetical protein